MTRARSHAVVVAAAAVVGGVLARSASAGPTNAPTPASALSAAAHDEADPEEPAGKGDNPYDEPGPARPPVAKIAVVQKDGMLRIPGGRFVMGTSSARAPRNERPAHAVVVAPFWLDRTEVTVGAYRACVDAGACTRPARTSATCTFDAGNAELPVSCVHWRDADAYCRHAGKRLPAESEWEYAARGPYRLPYPWGGAASCHEAVTLHVGQSGQPCAPRPAPVGTHPGGASVFGALDMAGNVAEWTADWYAESIGSGPAPRAGAAHVLRGGSWLSPPTDARTTSRDWGSALEAGPDVGFRCARNVE